MKTTTRLDGCFAGAQFSLTPGTISVLLRELFVVGVDSKFKSGDGVGFAFETADFDDFVLEFFVC